MNGFYRLSFTESIIITIITHAIFCAKQQRIIIKNNKNAWYTVSIETFLLWPVIFIKIRLQQIQIGK